jgi:hypothetical protein
MAAALGVAAGVFPALVRAQTPVPPDLVTVTCSSTPGSREYCTANTSRGIVLAKSKGETSCLLGKTWGYDDRGIWVSDGCAGDFYVSPLPEQAQPKPLEQPVPPSKAEVRIEAPPPAEQEPAPKPEEKKKTPAYIPNVGFRLFDGELGEVYFRLFAYVRYLNQKGLEPTYTDYFGTTSVVQRREDVQINKVLIPFAGWFLTPKFRYFLYVWSSNANQGDGAQVVVAGNLSYTFSRMFTLGGGITSLPCVRSTEGQYPYWLGVDARLTADEFFRGSYTTGFWLKGEIVSGLNYMAMIANNLSQLGVSAAQLDNGLNTESFMLSWLPTTGEFGLYGTFGDYDDHQQVATRVGAHFTHSREDRQQQPGTQSIENTQIRLTDGSIIFRPNLFAPGTTVEKVTYRMFSADAGIKYKGFSLEGEYYLRRLDNFSGPNASSIAPITDHGFQLQSSAMIIPKKLQVYLSGAEILGIYGNGSEIRAGMNWYFLKTRGLRINVEFLDLHNCPVGYSSVPYPVGGNGNVYTANVEMNF